MKISLCFVVVVKLISSKPQNGRRTLIRKGDITRGSYKGTRKWGVRPYLVWCESRNIREIYKECIRKYKGTRKWGVSPYLVWCESENIREIYKEYIFLKEHIRKYKGTRKWVWPYLVWCESRNRPKPIDTSDSIMPLLHFKKFKSVTSQLTDQRYNAKACMI